MAEEKVTPVEETVVENTENTDSEKAPRADRRPRGQAHRPVR